MDEKSFWNDFVNLAHSMGVFLYEDLLCIMSLRYQTIHILQVRDSGNLVNVRNIGAFCLEDDELFLNSHAQVCFFVHQDCVPGLQVYSNYSSLEWTSLYSTQLLSLSCF